MPLEVPTSVGLRESVPCAPCSGSDGHLIVRRAWPRQRCFVRSSGSSRGARWRPQSAMTSSREFPDQAMRPLGKCCRQERIVSALDDQGQGSKRGEMVDIAGAQSGPPMHLLTRAVARPSGMFPWSPPPEAFAPAP